MAFKITVPVNPTHAFNAQKTGALVTVQGSLYKRSLTTGLLELAVASATANEELYIGNENIAAAENKLNINVSNTFKGEEFLADTVNNSSAVHNGQRMILSATGDRLNNTGLDSAVGVFVQKNVIGAAADRKINAVRI